MTNSHGFFNLAAAAGGRLIHTVAGTEETTTAMRYLDLVQQVFTLLSRIHDEVLDTVVRVLETPGIAEAKDLIRELDGNSLRDVMKVEQLCDELRDKGAKLRPVVENSAGLAPDDRSALLDVISSFEYGEGETAALYNGQLYDLQTAVNNAEATGDIQNLLEAAATELSGQKAQFDLVARRAKAKLKALA
jgi:hypothetical protein